MAQDEVFAGPMGESVPTSLSSFAHRRGRADSTTSFTYYPDEEEEPLPPSEDDSAILDDESELHFEEEDGSADLEAGELSTMRRTSSGHSRSSVHDRLLRSDSTRTEGSALGRGHRSSQKIYIVNEDLTIVVAGFRTSRLGFALYLTICLVTFGLGYLLLRWLPRWQVRLIGSQCPLRDCSWVVIEVSTSVNYANLPEPWTVSALLCMRVRNSLLSYADFFLRINGVSLSSKISSPRIMGGRYQLSLESPRRDIFFCTTKMKTRYLTSFGYWTIVICDSVFIQ